MCGGFFGIRGANNRHGHAGTNGSSCEATTLSVTVAGTVGRGGGAGEGKAAQNYTSHHPPRLPLPSPPRYWPPAAEPAANRQRGGAGPAQSPAHHRGFGGGRPVAAARGAERSRGARGGHEEPPAPPGRGQSAAGSPAEPCRAPALTPRWQPVTGRRCPVISPPAPRWPPVPRRHREQRAGELGYAVVATCGLPQPARRHRG